MVKLQNGEFVSLAKIEMAVKKLLLVENCCACASSSAEYTVALVCPNPKEISVGAIDISRE